MSAADSLGERSKTRGERRAKHPDGRPSGLRRFAMMALLMLVFLLVPTGSAQAQPGCEGEPAPQPEAAGSGADGLLRPPDSRPSLAEGTDGLPPDSSLYGEYGTAGQQWHTIRDSCVDKLGSSAIATLNTSAWDLSKTINQSTITVYEAAASDRLLNNFNSLIENVVSELREGVWRPLLPTVIILGAVWLGWYGLIRKRVTLTLESAIWMVIATALGIWILVNPGQILSLAGNIVNSGGQLVNTAVSRVSADGPSTECPPGAPAVEQADWESGSEFAVRQNSHMLWSGLVCQPWMAGNFGNGPAADAASEEHGVALLQSQGISRTEQDQIQNGEVDPVELTEQKQEQYEGIASSVQADYPEVYPVFEGNQQGSRLSVATLALFASVFAGGLILAGSVALIVLKIGFLLLLLLAPIFLLIGVHPGYGRTVLLRWFEMMLGLLLKQVFIILLISLLVMCYGLVMATNLGWGLQMILLALFTLALFIYRKPFAHLFSSVNANTFTSRMVSDAVQSRALSRSANVLPPVAYMRAQKWGLKRSPQLAAAAGAIPAGGGTGSGDAVDAARGAAPGAPDSGEPDGSPTREDNGRARGTAGYGRVRGQSGPPPLHLGQGGAKGDSARPQQGTSTQRSASEAPRLSEAASGGLGTPSASSGGRGSGSIPPRPAGGYTGTGDTGWASIFGTGSAGSGQRPPSGGGGTSGPASGAADRAAPSSGQGIFRGRTATPPQGNIGAAGSRWGGPRPKQQKPAPPPRPSRPAAPPNRGEGGNWITGSSAKSNKDTPTSPFWAGAEAQRRRDSRRDVPFWLRDED
ncbi:type IV secretion system protein [Allosalinactinospora lopnorensis]|uniref:type IV secretion system protein n=1 Tax=Allosalinactinospora lopnorensis TaxID=1352348 RepID=UPI00373FD3ED